MIVGHRCKFLQLRKNNNQTKQNVKWQKKWLIKRSPKRRFKNKKIKKTKIQMTKPTQCFPPDFPYRFGIFNLCRRMGTFAISEIRKRQCWRWRVYAIIRTKIGELVRWQHLKRRCKPLEKIDTRDNHGRSYLVRGHERYCGSVGVTSMWCEDPRSSSM